MKKYKIPCSWVMSGTVEIEADTVGEAILKAEYAPLPTESEYIEGSFAIDLELLHEYLGQEKE
jgi:hypothetical protein